MTRISPQKTIPKKISRFMFRKHLQKLSNVRSTARSVGQRISNRLVKQPVKTFLVFLGLLLVVIAVGNLLRTPSDSSEEQAAPAKNVKTYKIGEAPRVTINGTVENSGVVTIYAQTSGVVQNIRVSEGDDVKKGGVVVELSTSYQGGNSFGIQRSIAARNYNHTVETYDVQKEIITKQRDIAHESSSNTEELRKISEQSKDETKNLIQINESSLSIIDGLIKTAESAVPQDQNLILSLKQQQSGIVNGLNAARASLRSIEYSTNAENPPTDIADVTKELTLKQLELQEKNLDLSKDLSLLQLRLAQVNESLMYPATPVTGTIERVHVRVGESVNPGQPIATVTEDSSSTSIIALVSKDVAENVSKLEESIVMLPDNNSFRLFPTYVSTQPTNGGLFSVIYHVQPNSDNPTYKNGSETQEKGEISQAAHADLSKLTEGQVVSVSIPVGYADTSSVMPFIPIDSVYQTQDSAFIYINDSGVAKSKRIALGSIFGSYVEVVSGLSKSDVIILNRNVINGDSVNDESK